MFLYYYVDIEMNLASVLSVETLTPDMANMIHTHLTTVVLKTMEQEYEIDFNSHTLITLTMEPVTLTKLSFSTGLTPDQVFSLVETAAVNHPHLNTDKTDRNWFNIIGLACAEITSLIYPSSRQN